MPTLVELIGALPEEAEKQIDQRLCLEASLRPVPVGRARRLGLLGTLQAKIAAAYLFYWIRSWFQTADARERALAETHWKTAVRLLDSMSYLRGAVMKIGQTMASFPHIVPSEFAETLDSLHYEAPPMHWALLREMVLNELGGPELTSAPSVKKKSKRLAGTGAPTPERPDWEAEELTGAEAGFACACNQTLIQRYEDCA